MKSYEKGTFAFRIANELVEDEDSENYYERLVIRSRGEGPYDGEDSECYYEQLVSKKRSVVPHDGELSFSEMILAEQGNDHRRSFVDHLDACVYLVRGTDRTKRDTWYFMQVDPVKKLLFDEDILQPGCVLTNYGTILKSGYGKDPPEVLKKKYFRD